MPTNALQIPTGNFETGPHQDFADPTTLENNFGDLFGYTVEDGVATLKSSDGTFPAYHGLAVGGSGTGTGHLINAAANSDSILGELNGPWLGVAEGDESLWINAFLNVKTWRLHGNIEGRTVDITTPAGTLRDDDLTGSGTQGPARPVSGLRTALGVEFDLLENDNGRLYVLNLRLGEFREMPIASWNSVPANTFVPRIFLRMAYSTEHENDAPWEIYSAGFSNTAGTLDTSIDVLGENIATFYSSGSGGSYSISLEADTFWSDSDSWYKG
jgi:hypothetical protein